MFNRVYGVKEHVYEEGMHFRVPWLEWPVDYDVRTKPRQISSPSGTKGMLLSLVCIFH